jgi:hypothetical protein
MNFLFGGKNAMKQARDAAKQKNRKSDAPATFGQPRLIEKKHPETNSPRKQRIPEALFQKRFGIFLMGGAENRSKDDGPAFFRRFANTAGTLSIRPGRGGEHDLLFRRENLDQDFPRLTKISFPFSSRNRRGASLSFFSQETSL